MRQTQDNRAAVWTRYWATGVAHSCAGSYDERYEGPIEKFWLSCFNGLPLGARVLDVGTGNGPVPRLLLSLPERPDLRCDAIDLAQIAPAWLNALPATSQTRLNFHGQCGIESNPFPDACFECIVSQWGLEYSELSKSIPEVLRLLKPGGSIGLVMHHQQGLPASIAAHELEHISWLMSPGGLVDCAQAMIRPMAQAATPAGLAQLRGDASALAIRERYNLQQDLLEQRLKSSSQTEVLKETRHALALVLQKASQLGQADAQAAHTQLKNALQDSVLRLQELRSHALDEEGVQTMARQLAKGATFELNILEDRKEIMGWTLRVSPR